MACKTCGCGKGKTRFKGDPIKKELCKILCEIETAVCEGTVDRKKRDIEARNRARKSPGLKRAIGKGKGHYGKQRYIPWDKNKLPPGGKRSPITGAELDKLKNSIRKKLTEAGKKILTDKAKSKLKRAWLKFIPIVNVISTAIDVVDIISTGADIYKMVDKALETFNNPVYKTFPDISIDGADGKMKIYDFKFSGDKWQGGQSELYQQAVSDSGGSMSKDEMEISPKQCKCDILDAPSVPTG